MIEREGIRVYPDQYYHHGKDQPGPIVPAVVEGQVVLWDPFTLYLALTAIHNGRNNHDVDRTRFRAYNQALYDGARKKNLDAMREAVCNFPDMVPQAEEILELPDVTFYVAAMNLTEAIW